MNSFIIIGVGAIGAYIGGRLAAAGLPVHFVGRPRTLKAIRENGLRVSDLDGFDSLMPADGLNLCESLGQISQEVLLNATVAPIVLVCVKSAATEAVGRDIELYCREDTPVVSFQNGVENVARLKTQAATMNVLAGMVPYNVILSSQSHSHRATEGMLLIEQHSVSVGICRDFGKAQLAMETRSNMLAVQWGKLLLNLNNPINALSNLPLKAQLEDRNYRRTLAALQIEALQVLTAARIEPAKVGKVAPRLLPKLLCLPDWLFLRIAASMLKMDSTARSSMWADLKDGKTTEIDDLSGAVVSLAAKSGVTALKNACVIELIKAYTPEQVWSGKRLFSEVSNA